MMEGFNKVINKYPQYTEQIVKAFETVMADPEGRDMEAELSGCDIEEEDIFELVFDVVAMMVVA